MTVLSRIALGKTLSAFLIIQAVTASPFSFLDIFADVSEDLPDPLPAGLPRPNQISAAFKAGFPRPVLRSQTPASQSASQSASSESSSPATAPEPDEPLIQPSAGYPAFPWNLGVKRSYVFWAPQGLNSAPVDLAQTSLPTPFDARPDKAVKWRTGPGFVILTQYDSSPMGPFDELLLIPGTYTITQGGPPHFRVTEAYSSIKKPTSANFPMAIPHKLADFQWEENADGTEDVTLYLPGETEKPLVSFQRLKVYDAAPTFPIPKNDIAIVQSVPTTEHAWANADHVKTKLAMFGGTPSAARFFRIRSNLQTANVENFMPVGVFFGNGTHVAATVTRVAA
eukprot:jgi/Botrbrau1/435/Bobra.110_2s0085.1